MGPENTAFLVHVFLVRLAAEAGKLAAVEELLVPELLVPELLVPELLVIGLLAVPRSEVLGTVWLAELLAGDSSVRRTAPESSVELTRASLAEESWLPFPLSPALVSWSDCQSSASVPFLPDLVILFLPSA